MSYGPVRTYSTSQASGVTFTSAVDVGNAYANISIEIPTMTSGTEIAVQGSSDGTTWRRIYHPVVSGTVAPTAILIGSAITQSIMQLANVRTRYLRVECQSAPTDGGHTFKFIVAE